MIIYVTNTLSRLYRWLFDYEFDFIRPVWLKGDQIPSLLATKSGRRERKIINVYNGDVKGK